MNTSNAKRKQESDVSTVLPESGTALDYLWNVQPDSATGLDADAPEPAGIESEQRNLTSTSIFRFTLSEYRAWLKSLTPPD